MRSFAETMLENVSW